MVVLFPRFFITLFATDTSFIEAAVPALHIYFLAYVFMAFQFSLFRKVILVIPLTIMLPSFIEPAVNGVFMAEPVSNVIGGLASFLTMYFTVYRRLDKSSYSNN